MSVSQFIRTLERTTQIAAWFGGGLLVLAAILVFIEVILRKVFVMSLGGADELSGYAFAISTSWGFAFALLHRAHVRIDIAYVRLPRPARAWLDLVALISLAIFALILTRHAAQAFLFTVDEGTHSNTPLQTPLWIPQGLWAAGLAYFCLVITVQILRCAAALARRDWASVNRIAGTRSVEEEVDEEIGPAPDDRTG